MAFWQQLKIYFSIIAQVQKKNEKYIIIDAKKSLFDHLTANCC